MISNDYFSFLKIFFTAWKASSLHYWIEMEIGKETSKIYMHSLVHCIIIYNNQGMETIYVSIYWWIDKESISIHIYIYNGILLCHKKEWNLAINIFNNMKGTWMHYAKWNESDWKRQIPCDLICKWNLKKIKAKYVSS